MDLHQSNTFYYIFWSITGGCDNINREKKLRGNNPALASTFCLCLTFIPSTKTVQARPGPAPEAWLSHSMSHRWTKNTFITAQAHAAGSLTRTRVESDSYLPFGQAWMDPPQALDSHPTFCRSLAERNASLLLGFFCFLFLSHLNVSVKCFSLNHLLAKSGDFFI